MINRQGKTSYLRLFLLPVLMSLFLGTLPAVPVRASKVTDLQQQKSATQSKITNNRNKTDSLEGQEEALAEAMEEANRILIENMASIQMLEETIRELNVAIAEKQAEYDAAAEEERKQYEAMKIRIKYMYEKGDTSYMQLLLSSESFSDMLNKGQYIEKMYEYDRKLLEEYQDIQEEVRQTKTALENEKAEHEEAERGLREEREQLEIQLADLREQYEDVDEQIAELQAQAAELAKQLTAQTQAISAAVEEEARLAEEARKKAEEEARLKAEAEAQQAAALAARQPAAAGQQGQTAQQAQPQTQTQAAATEAVTFRESDFVTQEQETSSSDTGRATDEPAAALARNAVSPSGKTGQDVANYACQFVGNRYVYGGTSLTNGCDCSGFTMAVYSHFGYSLPHNDVGQRGCGVAVPSLDQAIPGDIICYPGHVGIYIGNGTIVHASTAATGIKYSSATYRAYVGIRRIIN